MLARGDPGCDTKGAIAARGSGRDGGSDAAGGEVGLGGDELAGQVGVVEERRLEERELRGGLQDPRAGFVTGSTVAFFVVAAAASARHNGDALYRFEGKTASLPNRWRRERKKRGEKGREGGWEGGWEGGCGGV